MPDSNVIFKSVIISPNILPACSLTTLKSILEASAFTLPASKYRFLTHHIRHVYYFHVYFSTTDIDECRERPGMCAQQCLNLIGSYRCACSKGYRLHGRYKCRGKTKNQSHSTHHTLYTSSSSYMYIHKIQNCMADITDIQIVHTSK